VKPTSLEWVRAAVHEPRVPEPRCWSERSTHQQQKRRKPVAAHNGGKFNTGDENRTVACDRLRLTLVYLRNSTETADAIPPGEEDAEYQYSLAR